ncbi:hypothetical protein P261_00361 [Lachnospiraceae bacterium TWA4]|nr:hypothetical protein P261_00361 [Lachnospiraceae bacterium TWA4]
MGSKIPKAPKKKAPKRIQKQPKSRGSVGWNYEVFILSVVIMIVTWFIEVGMYASGTITGKSYPFLIASIFLMLYVFIVLAVFIYSNLMGTFDRNIFTGNRDMMSVIVLLVIVGGILFASTVLFQWSYGLGTDSTLLAGRSPSSLGFLYGLMRIVFITIIGSEIGCGVALAYGDFDELIIGGSILKSFIGALFMEIGTSLVGNFSGGMAFIMWFFLTIVVTNRYIKARPRIDR